jgi:signal transduction histidine kinase/CheY-like chemotaxis protein
MSVKRKIERSISIIPMIALIIIAMFLYILSGDQMLQAQQPVIYLILFLSIFSFWILYYKYTKEKEENLLLLNVIDMIKSYASQELEAVHTYSDSIKNKEEQYTYIQHNLQLLYDKIEQTTYEGESKSQFLSTMSHEIRTPLNGIIGFTKLLKDMDATKEQEEFLLMIENSSQHLINIVNDVLDLSKMNADKMVIEHISFDLIEMLETTTASLVQQAEQKDIEYAVFIDPSLDQYFFGDPTKLSQILTNLIGNAIKFTDAYGKINIFVINVEDSEERTEVRFEVQDDGIGLSDSQKENIFEAFSQATASTSRKYGGTGLGLSISSNMVRLMGGHLEVESKEGEGSTFFFSLKLDKDIDTQPKELSDFSHISVGVAIPADSIERQLDKNLKSYISYLGADFSFYYYDELFGTTPNRSLPDLMIFDHHYARLPGELEACASLECKSVLRTSANLRSRIDTEQHPFDDIVLSPMNMSKTVRILENALEKRDTNDQPSLNVENEKEFQGLFALVADDNMINRKLINIILDNLGVDVTLVSNGQEAVDAFESKRYDIVFMDIQMPVMDGLEASKKILTYEENMGLEHVPVVALTADSLPGDREKYISKGMDDYATKPLNVEVLKKIISTHCLVVA